jgi:hypothetical protein
VSPAADGVNTDPTGDTSGWAVFTGTRTGPHHRRRDEPNQDAVTARADGGWVVLAVADGAGSLPRSGEGANRAVTAAATAATTVLTKQTDGDPGAVDVTAAVTAAVDAARTDLVSDPDAAELGATLAVVVAGPEGWAAGLVGDSFAVVGSAGEYQLLRPPAAGEFANITRLLTSADPQPLIVAGAGRPQMVAVASDGLAHPALGATGPHRGFFDPLTAHAVSGGLDIDALLAYMDTAARLDDDTTIAVAVPAGNS